MFNVGRRQSHSSWGRLKFSASGGIAISLKLFSPPKESKHVLYHANLGSDRRRPTVPPSPWSAVLLIARHHGDCWESLCRDVALGQPWAQCLGCGRFRYIHNSTNTPSRLSWGYSMSFVDPINRTGQRGFHGVNSTYYPCFWSLEGMEEKK